MDVVNAEHPPKRVVVPMLAPRYFISTLSPSKSRRPQLTFNTVQVTCRPAHIAGHQRSRHYGMLGGEAGLGNIRVKRVLP